MKQKIIIALSVFLLLIAVWLIARDLFRHSATSSTVSCCGDDINTLKKIDPALIGYNKIKVIETGMIDLSGITVSEENRIFICGNGKIVSFDTLGQKLDEFSADTLTTCIAVSGNNLLTGNGSGITYYNLKDKSHTVWKNEYQDGYITSVAISEGYGYAADAKRKLILKYDLSGKFIQYIGKKDTLTDSPGFIIPSLLFDIAFDGFNNLWASNTGRLRVERYTNTGNFRDYWGKASYENNGFSGCCNPAHLAILPDGCFVTYEKGVDHIKVFNQGGEFLCFAGGAGSFRGNADFNLGNNHLVKDLATGPDGRIYVLDAYNRINIFQKKGN